MLRLCPNIFEINNCIVVIFLTVYAIYYLFTLRMIAINSVY